MSTSVVGYGYGIASAIINPTIEKAVTNLFSNTEGWKAIKANRKVWTAIGWTVAIAGGIALVYFGSREVNKLFESVTIPK